MIARLSGNLASKSALHTVVDVHGVGYRVFVPLSTFYALPEVGQPVTLEIFTVVREDAIHLFGFHTLREKSIFERLLGVSKIGPKVAIGILSGISTEELIAAIEEGDVARINAVPGVGTKTAERLIIELRGKVGAKTLHEAAGMISHDGAALNTNGGESVSALVNLGYKRQEAEKAVKNALQLLGGNAAIEAVIKSALQLLSA